MNESLRLFLTFGSGCAVGYIVWEAYGSTRLRQCELREKERDRILDDHFVETDRILKGSFTKRGPKK